uniref:Uncharacterized protein n=1 Tax=Oryza sativa subsp. japonica TaxID=39947 RepID=Q9XIX4_ORYSJ|nr:hypothetical protein [Oryza sativa Japonica Group]
MLASPEAVARAAVAARRALTDVHGGRPASSSTATAPAINRGRRLGERHVLCRLRAAAAAGARLAGSGFVEEVAEAPH